MYKFHHILAIPTAALLSTTAAIAVDIPVAPGESINAAMASAQPGDRIILEAGTYQEGETIRVPKDVSIIGAALTSPSDTPLTILDGQNAHAVLSGPPISTGGQATYANLYIQNGMSDSTLPSGMDIGFGIIATVTSCWFTGNHGAGPTFLAATNSVATLSNCTFKSNSVSKSSGGSLYPGVVSAELVDDEDSVLTIRQCNISDNDAEAAIYVSGGDPHSSGKIPRKGQTVVASLNIQNTTVHHNTGSGVELNNTYARPKNFTITHTKVEENGDVGIGVVFGPYSFVELLGSTICDNTTGQLVTLGSNVPIDGYDDRGSNCLKDRCAECPAPGDIDGNGVVDSDDSLALQTQLGICQGDVNGDGIVNAADLGIVIGVWGNCP